MLVGGCKQGCAGYSYTLDKDWPSSVREDLSVYQLHSFGRDTVEAVREEGTPAEPSRVTDVTA